MPQTKGPASRGNARHAPRGAHGKGIATTVVGSDSDDDGGDALRRAKGVQVQLQGWLERIKGLPEWSALPQGLVQATSAALSTYGMLYQAAVRAA